MNNTLRLFPLLLCCVAYLLCIDEYNPFSDYSNARVVVKTRTFENGDRVPVFSAETLNVELLFKYAIDSFTVRAESNRFWRADDTTVVGQGALDDFYTFAFSFYDTGAREISVTTFRGDETPYTEKYRIRVYSPLAQAPVAGYNGSPLRLTTPQVMDQADVLYHWRFGDAIEIISQDNTCDTILTMALTDTLGTLWVSDWNKNFSSPAVPFAFFIADTIKPTIQCANVNYTEGLPLKATDSVFIFKVQIFDQGDTTCPVDSASIDGMEFNIKNISASGYLHHFRDMQKYRETPRIVTVTAMDNRRFRNMAFKTFQILYDTTADASGTVEFEIFSIKDTATTSDSVYTFTGYIINRLNRKVFLEDSVNGVFDKRFDTISADTVQSWQRTLSLTDSVNTVIFQVPDETGAVQAKKKVILYLNPQIKDLRPPIIWQVYVDGQLYALKTVYTRDRSTKIRIFAFDELSSIRNVLVDSIEAVYTGNNFYEADIQPRHLPQNAGIQIIAFDIHGNRTETGISVIRNTPPAAVRDSLRRPVIPAGAVYRDTIHAFDVEDDSLTFVFSRKGTWSITDSVLSFTPAAAHIGKDSIVFAISDGYEASREYVWRYEVIDTVEIDSVKLSPDIRQRLPQWMVAGTDSLSTVLQVVSGTPPLRFTVSISDPDTAILTGTDDSLVRWKPSLADTGLRILHISVIDSNKTRDDLFHSIRVLPPNSAVLSLTYTVTPDSVLRAPDTLYLRDYASATIICTIHDADNSLIEAHEVTVSFPTGSTTFTADTQIFSLNITPQLNKNDEQLLITVKDREGNIARRTLYIRYPNYYTPDGIDSLRLWYDAADTATVLNYLNEPADSGEDVEWWLDKSPSGFDANDDGLEPVYVKKKNGAAVAFTDMQMMYLRNDFGGWMAGNFSLFVVCKPNAMQSFRSYPLLSACDNLQSSSLGVMHGRLGFFSNFPTYDTIGSSLRLSANTRSLVSFESQPVRASRLVAGIDNHAFEVLTVNKSTYQECRIGGTTNVECWNGDISEIILFTRPLSDKERRGLMEYFKKKYGLDVVRD